MFETAIDYDPAKIFGWRNAVVHTSMHSYAGGNGSAVLAGDAQGFSNISASGDAMLFEMWLRQTLLGGKLTVKAGKIESNTDFDFIENAGSFLNSTMGHSPTLFDMPTYPSPRLGTELILDPAGWVSLRTGIFRNDNKSSMLLSEAGTRWRLAGTALPGRLAYGYWVRTGSEM